VVGCALVSLLGWLLGRSVDRLVVRLVGWVAGRSVRGSVGSSVG
jgi:hypothetical protein